MFLWRFVRGSVPGSILGAKIDEKSIKNGIFFCCFFGSLRLRFPIVQPSRCIAIYSTLSTSCFFRFFSFTISRFFLREREREIFHNSLVLVYSPDHRWRMEIESGGTRALGIPSLAWADKLRVTSDRLNSCGFADRHMPSLKCGGGGRLLKF